ncbi:MAG TPA: hypothetical protein VHZ55_00860 [Bryobacteraceae bacterium]|nr:hypothetical protein [Bryobacteraceae bacterium]
MTPVHPRAADAAQTKEESTPRHIDWLRFPTLEKIFQHDSSQVLAQAETEQRRYKALSETGGTGERVRARLAAISYGHVIALLHELENARTKPGEGPQHERANSR